MPQLQALQVLDHVFVVLFALEAAAKVLVQGFVANGRGSYLRSAWSALDFGVVLIGARCEGHAGRGACRAMQHWQLRAQQRRAAVRACLRGCPTVLNAAITTASAAACVHAATGIAVMAATLSGDVHSLASLRALRALRALRPLRLASRLPGMRLVVSSLVASLRPLGSVLLVAGLLYVIFGIMAVNMLAVR